MTNWFQTRRVNPIYGWGLSKRWIVQGGPAIDEKSTMNDVQQKMQALIEQAREAGCVYVEMRCFADYSAYREAFEKAGFTYVPHYDVTIDPKRELPDAKMRQIRRMLEDGYSIRKTSVELDVWRWYQQLRRLYWYKIHRPLPSLDFFYEMLEDFGCTLLVVEKHEEIVGGVFLASEVDKSKAYEWYICGQILSTWAAIDWCRKEGIQLFDTMGAGEPDVPYGVRDFKLQMGGDLHEWGRYICVLRPRWYRLGCRIIRFWSKKNK